MHGISHVIFLPQNWRASDEFMDNLTVEQRSHCMSRVRNRNTDIEAIVRSELFRRGWRFRKHVTSLPGCPDIVFMQQRIAVFIDGDFWHGYQFPRWQATLSGFWRQKIAKNRKRDRNNFAKLRRRGWRVLRIWQHEIKNDLSSCVVRIESFLTT